MEDPRKIRHPPRSVSWGGVVRGGQCRLVSGGWVGRAGGGRWSGGSSAGRSARAVAGWSGTNWPCRQGAGRVGAGGFRQASPIAWGRGGRGPGRWCRAVIGAHVERAAVKCLAGACHSQVGGGRVDSRGGSQGCRGGRCSGGCRAGRRSGPGRYGRCRSARHRSGRVPGVSDYKGHRGWADVGRRSGGSAAVVLMSGWTDVGREGDWGGGRAVLGWVHATKCISSKELHNR